MMAAHDTKEERLARTSRDELVARLLAGSWRLPSDGLCRDLVTGRYAVAMRESLRGEVAGRRNFAQAGLSTYLAQFEGEFADAAVARRELEAEYIRLFIAAEHVPCPPYESVWVDRTDEYGFGLMFGEATDRVSAAYLEAGMEPEPDYHDAPDHVAMEMEFLAHLCSVAGGALQDEDDTAFIAAERCYRDFVRDHPGKWVGGFAEEVQRQANCAFYRALAAVTSEWLTDIATQPIA